MTSTQARAFEATDYGVFGTMLATSLFIGIYYGFSKKGANATDDYLLGNRQLATIPVAMSLIASQINSNILVLYPSEVYFFGLEIMQVLPGIVVVTLVTVFISLPVLYNCKITNVYEYLELRFDHRVRKLATFLFTLFTLGYLPAVIFAPSLALSQVSGINVHVINAATSSVCIIYTMMGGIKAVVWTDVVQAGVMILSCLTFFVIGLVNVGSFGEVINRSAEGSRLQMFNMDISLTKRQSFWSYFFNFIFLWFGYVSFNQMSVQRLVSVPTLKHSKRAMYIFCIGYIIITSVNFFIGLIMYATYYKCDPFKQGVVSKPDKMVPHFLMDTVGYIPGMPGLFIAAIFSASLSTASSALNTLAGVIYQDVIQKISANHKDSQAKLIMMIIVFILGVYSILAGFMVSSFAQILQAIIIISSLTVGATTGIFLLGMLTPWANAKGTILATIVSLTLMTWIAIGGQIAAQNGSLVYPPLPLSVEECHLNATLSILPTTPANITKLTTAPKEPFFLYKLSFNYYAVANVLIICIVGLAGSFATGTPDLRKLDRSLFAPCIHRMLPKTCKHTEHVPEEVELFKKKENLT